MLGDRMIRDYEIYDYKNLFLLFQEEYLFHQKLEPALFNESNLAVLDNMLANYLKSPITKAYVLQVDNSLVGYILCQWQDDGVWIDDLFIAENYRGQGYGHKLLNYVERLAKEHQKFHIGLNCWEANKQAQAIYRHLGFKEKTSMMLKIIN